MFSLAITRRTRIRSVTGAPRRPEASDPSPPPVDRDGDVLVENPADLLQARPPPMGVELALGNGDRDHAYSGRHSPPCEERPAHMIGGADEEDGRPAFLV